MSKVDKEYHQILSTILNEGRWYDDPNREGVKRIQIPKYNFEYDLRDGFPILTTKKINFKNIVGELLWFLSGSTNIKYLIDNNINIWNKDAYNYYLKTFDEGNVKPLNFTDWLEAVKKDGHNGNNKVLKLGLGDCGRIYGAQWRAWDLGMSGKSHFDQISRLIQNLKEKPLSTEHIVTAWNPAELDDMALPPCHFGFQLMVYPLTYKERCKYNTNEKSCLISRDTPEYGFDLIWEQRSVDTFLGLPYNIASYALLAHIIGEMVNMVPGKIYGDLRNVHLYDNSIDAANEQLKRDVDKYDNSELLIDYDINQMLSACAIQKEYPLDKCLNQISIEDFQIKEYKSYPKIGVEMLSK